MEMVYIPQGSFYAGDNGTSAASFIKGSNDNRPWFIESEDAIAVTNTAVNGYYYRSAKDFWDTHLERSRRRDRRIVYHSRRLSQGIPGDILHEI